MKVNNNISISFNAGLTRSMKSEIERVDVKKVSHYMSQMGIYNDFKDNKVAAWCSFVTALLIKSINSHFNAGFKLPRGIIVDDFTKINDAVERNATGFTNLFPTELYKGSNEIVSDGVIFFNSFKEHESQGGNLFWNHLDEAADKNYAQKKSTTDFFLEPFLHEFFHVIHEQNMLKLMSGKELLDRICKIKDPEIIKEFQKKYQNLFDSLCDCAQKDPLEMVACDLSKRSIDSINKESFIPEKDFIKNSPYGGVNFIKQFLKTPKTYRQDKALRQFWNGEF